MIKRKYNLVSAVVASDGEGWGQVAFALDSDGPTPSTSTASALRSEGDLVDGRLAVVAVAAGRNHEVLSAFDFQDVVQHVSAMTPIE